MTTKQKNQLIKDYILTAISGEGYNITLSNDVEKLQFLANCFKGEYCFADNLKRYGSYQNCLANWFAGLPSSFNIDYENYKIIEIAKIWESLPENCTAKQENKILSNWFNFIAAKVLQLMAKNKVSVF